MPQPPIIRHQRYGDRSWKEIKAFLSPHQKMVWYGKTEYKNSGKMTANEIKAAFSKFSNTIYISENCTGRECFNMSYQRKVHLLRAARNPTLVGPSHRGSGIPDKKIEIAAVNHYVQLLYWSVSKTWALRTSCSVQVNCGHNHSP